MKKENILNYEVQMIDYQAEGISKPDISLNHQYTSWELDSKIFKLMGSSPCTIRWIGNHESADLDAFVYIILSMSLKKQSLLLKLKEIIYQLSQKYLEKSSQKLIVQFLCLIQYTQDKFSFLRKYPQVVKIIVSILKSYEKQTLETNNINLSKFCLQSPIKQKRKQSFSILCQRFNFIKISNPNEYTFKFVSEKQIIFVVIEKDCFFVVEKSPGISDGKNQSYDNFLSKMRHGMSIISLSSNTIQKSKSEKRGASNHMIHKNKKSQNLLDHYNNHSIFDCSIEEIHCNLQNNNKDDQRIHKKGELDKYNTYQQTSLNQSRKKFNKSPKKKTESDTILMIKQFEFQQRRKEHWLKLEKEYYERKKEISHKVKQDKIQMKSKFNNKDQLVKIQKERKKSFNSFTGYSQKERLDTDFASIDDDKKSSTKSYEGQNAETREFYRNREASLRQSPVAKKKKMLKKKTSNQIYVNQDNRLSVIQEEKRMKFLNFNANASTHHRSPKLTSFHSSNRQTLNSNISVTFKYINHNPEHSNNFFSPNFQKMRYHGSPLKV